MAKIRYRKKLLPMQGNLQPIKGKPKRRDRQKKRQKSVGALGKASTQILRRDFQNRLDLALVRKAKLVAQLKKISKVKSSSQEAMEKKKKLNKTNRLINEIKESIGQLYAEKRTRHR